MRSLALALPVLLGACGAPRVVPLVGTAGPPVTLMTAESVPLEVLTRGTAVRDPLPVRGADVAYDELEASVGVAVSTAAAPWAASQSGRAPGGYQLVLELTQADAEADDDRLLVTLAVRATLRGRADHRYLAQTQARCREGGRLAPDRGVDVVHACAVRLGRDLAGWLGGLSPGSS
jgi:hypothetical protein